MAAGLISLCRTLAIGFIMMCISGAMGTRVRRQVAPACTFFPADNTTFIDSIYPHFDKDSGTRIIEYKISFENAPTFLWLTGFSPEVYKPRRWYRTQGEGTSKLLLVYHVYYGLLRPFLGLGIETVDIALNVTPTSCLPGLLHNSLEDMLRLYLLTDFSIDEKSVEEPFTYSDEVYICNVYITDENGFGRVEYRCCGYDSDKRLKCHSVYEDGWVWALRAFFFLGTILLFLYFPALIPKGYRIYTYVYYPPDGLQFNLQLTSRPQLFRNLTTSCVIQPREWKSMHGFRNQVEKLQPEVTYTAHVKRLDLDVGQDRLLSEGQSPVSLARSFFDALVRCKIRHSDPLEDCCRTSICGTYCCKNCPPWHAWLRGLRTIVVMVILSIPAWPIMYAMAANGLEYQALAKAIETRGLERTIDFYVGPVFGKVAIGVLAFMYTLNIFIVVLDGATDQHIMKMYSDVLEVAEKKAKLKHKIEKTHNTIKKAFNPVKRFGILFLPVWLVIMCVLPIALLVLFIINAPMLKVVIQATKMMLRRCHMLEKRPMDEEKVGGMFEMFWFLVTMIFVFIVFTLGVNFFFYVIAMIIMKVLVDAQLAYRVLPVALLLLLYVRDSFSRVSQKYASFQSTIMGTLKNNEAEDLRREALNSWNMQQNKIFKILPSDVVEDKKDTSDSEDAVVEMDGNEGEKKDDTVRTKPSRRKSLFLVKNGLVRMRPEQLILFLNKNDILYTSKKFIFHACTMSTEGAPGRLEENYIKAVIDFAKITLFLLFVFLVVMAYGSAYYISPTNHLFVTLVTGLIPLILRNIFLKRDAVETVNTSNYRFEAQLNDKIRGFSQSWDVHDLHLSDIEATDAALHPDKGRCDANSTWEITMGQTPKVNMDNVDLVLDISRQHYTGKTENGNKTPSGRAGKSPQRKIGVVSCMSSDNANTADNSERAQYDPWKRFGANAGTPGPQPLTVRYDTRYDHERHERELRRDHEARNDEIAAGIDSVVVSNVINRGFHTHPRPDSRNSDPEPLPSRGWRPIRHLRREESGNGRERADARSVEVALSDDRALRNDRRDEDNTSNCQ